MILLTPDELTRIIQQANGPLLARLECIERKLLQGKLCYTANEIGKLLGVTGRLVRTWITEGKADSQGRVHYLKAVELLRGRYTIQLADVEKFISFF